MPYPTQIDRETVLQTARQKLETDGIDGLSLHQLAAQLGVKAPSLYRYFANKNALLQAMNEITAFELVEMMQAVDTTGKESLESLREMFHAFRRFVHANPTAYQLAFGNSTSEIRPNAEFAEQLALPLQAQMAKLTGEENSLAALRGGWALIHGFVMLELTEQFQRGGSLEQAFEQAITAYLKGWKQD